MAFAAGRLSRYGHVRGLTLGLRSAPMSESGSDPIIERLREQIAAADRAVLDAVNRRLELVVELRRYKDSRGIEFVDPEQERRLIERLVQANRGPVSSDGLRELFARLLELTKREVAARGD